MLKTVLIPAGLCSKRCYFCSKLSETGGITRGFENRRSPPVLTLKPGFTSPARKPLLRRNPGKSGMSGMLIMSQTPSKSPIKPEINDSYAQKGHPEVLSRPLTQRSDGRMDG